MAPSEQNTIICMDVFYFNYYFHRLRVLFPYFFFICTGLVGILTLARMRVGRVTFSSKGTMRVKVSLSFYRCFLFNTTTTSTTTTTTTNVFNLEDYILSTNMNLSNIWSSVK